MVTGRVLQFDHVRGYGFVAADDGGDDVFLHSSVFEGDPDELTPGTKVEFRVMAGDRGRKAFAARLVDDDPGNDLVPPPRLATPPQPAPEPSLDPASTAQAPHAPGKDQAQGDEQMRDVLSPTEFGQELTELLLSNVPSLTGQQILQVRQSVLELAGKHGWVDL